MKKFLFTLAALLAVGSMSADNYFFIEQQENPVPGQEYEVSLQAHFDNRVSAFQLDLGSYDENGNFLAHQLPAGVQIVFTDKGDEATITGLNARGRAASWTASLGGNDDNTVLIGGVIGTDIMYQEIDGVLTNCGAPKWEPGDYDDMFYLYIVYGEEYDGSPIVIKTSPSCGDDPRGNTAPKGETFLRPEWNDAPPTPVYAPEPTFDWSEGSFTMEALCADHNVVLMIGDEVVENPYTVIQTYEEQTITFTAYTEANAQLGETDNSATVSTTVTVPAKSLTPSNKPTINVTPGDEVYTIEATGTGTVVLYLENGQKALVEVGNPYEVARPAYGEADLVLNFKASNLDVDPENEVQYDYAWAEKEVTVPAKDPTYYQTPDPEITVTDDPVAQTVTITATGEGTVTLKVTGAEGTVGENSGQGSCSVVVPYGTEVTYVNAYATAKAAGEFVYPGDASKTMIEIPAKTVLEKTQDPTVHVTSGDQTKTITCEPNGNDPESVIYISLDGGVTFVEYTEPVVLGIGEYDIVVYAVAPGKDKSNNVEMHVIVDENTQPDPTAVNELNGEKAVAGVRYFNMAGQEMQEANGVTIVVTTYTDGTTSAVKVIK